MIPDALPTLVQCPTCTRQAEEEIAELRAKLHNLQTTVDALAERCDDAETLCNWLALHLEAFDSDFVDSLLDEGERDLWDSVQPYGPAEEDG